VDLADAAAGQIQLRCTLAEFQALRPAQETESVPDLDPTGHRNAPKKVKWVAVGIPGRSPAVLARPPESQAPQQVTVDSVPSGEVAIHPGMTVYATDGEVGQVQGLAVNLAATR
jgi:hypothetical protein